MNFSKVIIIIPTYNEKQNIEIIIRQLFEISRKFSILIVDDNSPDGTYLNVSKLQKHYKNLYMIKRDAKMGLGTAYIDGFKFALDNPYDFIVQMDADLSHSPAYIPQMLALLDKYDVVVGSRYISGGGAKDWPIGRKILSTCAQKFAKLMIKMPVNDVTSGFKCYKRQVLEKIDFGKVCARGYAFQIRVSWQVFKLGFKIAEYPIIFQGRRNDKSKMSLGIAVEAFIDICYIAFKIF